MANLKMSSFMLCLMFCIGSINSAVTTGYFYDNPIRPFNSPTFSSLRSTGQFSSIPFGQKVESNTQTRLKVPPIPSLPPLATYIPKQTTQYQSAAFGRVQTSTPTSYNTRTVQQQQIQQARNFQLQQQQQQQRLQQQQRQQQHQLTTQFPRPQQQKLQFQQTQLPYSYPKAQVPVNTQFANNQQSSFTLQPRNNIPRSTNRPTTQFYQITTPTLNTQKQTTKPSILTVAPQKVVTIPTSSSINTQSTPTQTTPDFYVVDGRQLKQYKVYEHIDNDIDQEIHNFIPANFFLNTYHSMISDTHPLGEDVQIQNRASGVQQRSQQIQQSTPNTIALGSGGLGFVKLPNGNVYLGSGSLGYISSLQHSQDVQDLRSRTSSTGPDALHFGHGPLSDSFYYNNQKD